jgi:hypothetical protein
MDLLVKELEKIKTYSSIRKKSKIVEVCLTTNTLRVSLKSTKVICKFWMDRILPSQWWMCKSS